MSALDGWIDVFRAGRHRDSSGRERTWTESDLDAVASSRDAGDPAPVVVGHPSADAPAYAWVDGLRRVGDRLQARLRDVDPAFRAAVEAGRYAGRSVALSAGDGGWRLRHLGFLGGAAPAVEGLAPTRFAAPASRVYEFAEPRERWAWGALARLLRGLRERIVAGDGIEAADRALAERDIEAVAEAAAAPDEEAPAFAGAAERETGMGDESEGGAGGLAAERAALAAEREALAAERARLDAERAADAASRRRREAETEIAAHVAGGRALPAEAAGLSAFMASLPDGGGAEIAFAAADGGETSETPRAWFAGFLSRLPRRVDYRERAPDGDAAPTADGGGPQALARAARALMAADRTGELTVDRAVRTAMAQGEHHA